MKYNPVNTLNVVWEKNPGASVQVGRLAYVKRQVVFEYATEFLTLGINLSPFFLPSGAEIITSANKTLFDSLHGVFNDSLPDGWGRLLLDRQLQQLAIDPRQLSPLDRLAHVGRRGVGALSYEPDKQSILAGSDPLDLEQLATDSQRDLRGAPEEVITELLTLAGSSAGARPKILVGVSPDKSIIMHDPQQLESRLENSLSLEHWLIKFPSSHDPDDIAAIEYAYSRMARDAGIDMAPTHLFSTSAGNRYFGTKRFDRCGDQRIHMHTACGLLNADFRIPSLDYKDLLAATLHLTGDQRQAEKMFALAVFNVLVHNRDDHSKNFSYLMDSAGTWTMAPAYDLTFSSGPGGEHSTMMMGNGKNPGEGEFLALAETAMLDKRAAQDIIERIKTVIAEWPQYAREAGVSRGSQQTIGQRINR